MIETYNFQELRKIRNYLLKYKPDMTLKELFFRIDSILISNSTRVENILNLKKEVNTKYIKPEWDHIIAKSSAIGSLFNELENICVLDQNSLTSDC